MIPLTLINRNIPPVQWVLDWWAAHKHEYPLMFVVARDYLPIPGAEVDVKRLFNIRREILGSSTYINGYKDYEGIGLTKGLFTLGEAGPSLVIKKITCM